MDPIIRNYLERAVEILLSAAVESLLDEMAIDPIAYDCGGAFVCPQPSVRQVRNEISDYLTQRQRQ